MLTLAFESSAKTACVALCREEFLIAQYFQNSGLTHSATLLPMAEDLLKSARLSFKDIELLAVAQGPGSFTGIRIGVACVKGISWAAGIPAAGVSTLEAMSWHGLAAPEGALVCAVMDARRSQVYNALFEISEGRPQRLCKDRAISLEDLAAGLLEMRRPVFLVGDGAELCREFLNARGLTPLPTPVPFAHQTAWGVAMAARSAVHVPADELFPIYLRLSQAERERQKKMKNKEVRI